MRVAQPQNMKTKMTLVPDTLVASNLVILPLVFHAFFPRVRPAVLLSSAPGVREVVLVVPRLIK